MSFLFTSGPSSDPTSLSSTPVQPSDNLDDSPVLTPSEDRRAEDTTLPTTLPTSLPDTPRSLDKPISDAETEEIYTVGALEHGVGPEDTLAFDLDLETNGISVSRVEPYSRSPSSSGSSVSEPSEGSSPISSSSEERDLSTTNSQWATLGESSHADREEYGRRRLLVPGSPSAASASTILPIPPRISTVDKGKAPERPGILRTEESRHRRRRSGEEKGQSRRRVVRRTVYEDGICAFSFLSF